MAANCEVVEESATLEKRLCLFSPSGFTLVELLVATTILLILIFLLLQVVSSMTSIWSNSTGTISNFEAARSAFTVINRELARTTLEPYLDYIDNTSPFGKFRTAASPQNFVPYSFARASELHFVSGSAAALIPNGTALTTPGGAIFFQAPLGVINTTANKYLQRALNDVGFYIQYSDLSTSMFPTWLNTFFGGTHHYGYRLIESVEPTEKLSIYQYTSVVGNTAPVWSLGWLPTAPPSSAPTFPDTNDNPNYVQSVLAEDVVLLLFRPRLNEQDEQSLMKPLTGQTYTAAAYAPLQGGIISPNYAYDSRTWEPGYNFTAAGANVESTTYGLYMRNQIPPIVDVVMVCVDPVSLVHLQITTNTPPIALQVPASWTAGPGPNGGTPFSHSADLEYDLKQFSTQLATNHLRFRIFRSSVQMMSAAWSNE